MSETLKSYDEIVKIRIHGNSEMLWQDVYCYVTRVFDCIDVTIRMPLFIPPSDIQTDVEEGLKQHHIFAQIEDLKYTLSPEIL